MAAVKRQPFPVILLANDLLEGDVVFAADGGWSRDPRQAKIAQDEAAAQALENFAAREIRDAKVVGATLVDVELRDGAPVPRHIREAIRAKGPSTRPDLGKQADFQI